MYKSFIIFEFRVFFVYDIQFIIFFPYFCKIVWTDLKTHHQYETNQINLIRCLHAT